MRAQPFFFFFNLFPLLLHTGVFFYSGVNLRVENFYQHTTDNGLTTEHLCKGWWLVLQVLGTDGKLKPNWFNSGTSLDQRKI